MLSILINFTNQEPLSDETPVDLQAGDETFNHVPYGRAQGFAQRLVQSQAAIQAAQEELETQQQNFRTLCMQIRNEILNDTDAE